MFLGDFGRLNKTYIQSEHVLLQYCKKTCCWTRSIRICENVSCWLHYVNVSLKLFMFHCCHLSLIPIVIIIIVSFQCKGKGLEEELVESADYLFGFVRIACFCWIAFRFLHLLYYYKMHDFAHIVSCALGPTCFLLIWRHVTCFIDPQTLCFGATWADWTKLIFSPSMFFYNTIRKPFEGRFPSGFVKRISVSLHYWFFPFIYLRCIVVTFLWPDKLRNCGSCWISCIS